MNILLYLFLVILKFLSDSAVIKVNTIILSSGTFRVSLFWVSMKPSFDTSLCLFMSEIAMMEHHNYADWLIYLLAFLDELQSEAGLVKSITVHAPGWCRCTLASIHSVHLKLNVVLRQSRDRCELPLIDFALN